MKSLFSAVVVCAMTFLIAGCSHYGIAAIGYSGSGPTVGAIASKTWNSEVIKSPCDSTTWFGRLCTSEIVIRCDEDGDWAAMNTVANMDEPHIYSVLKRLIASAVSVPRFP
jgi:hypothetical protein